MMIVTIVLYYVWKCHPLKNICTNNTTHHALHANINNWKYFIGNFVKLDMFEFLHLQFNSRIDYHRHSKFKYKIFYIFIFFTHNFTLFKRCKNVYTAAWNVGIEPSWHEYMTLLHFTIKSISVLRDDFNTKWSLWTQITCQ